MRVNMERLDLADDARVADLTVGQLRALLAESLGRVGAAVRAMGPDERRLVHELRAIAGPEPFLAADAIDWAKVRPGLREALAALDLRNATALGTRLRQLARAAGSGVVAVKREANSQLWAIEGT